MRSVNVRLGKTRKPARSGCDAYTIVAAQNVAGFKVPLQDAKCDSAFVCTKSETKSEVRLIARPASAKAGTWQILTRKVGC